MVVNVGYVARRTVEAFVGGFVGADEVLRGVGEGTGWVGGGVGFDWEEVLLGGF